MKKDKTESADYINRDGEFFTESEALEKEENLIDLRKDIFYINREGKFLTEDEALEEENLKSLKKTADINKKAEIWLSLGQIKERANDYAAAEQYYRRGVKLNTNHGKYSYFLLNNIGYCLNMLGKYSEAEVFLRKAIDFDPERANGYKNLGISMERQEKYKEAAELYLKGNSANPSDERCKNLYTNLQLKHPDISKKS
jgi:tetratricopeptide (TPR) repeat protein